MGRLWSHFFYLLFFVQLQLTTEFRGVKFGVSPGPRRPGCGGGGGGSGGNAVATSTEAGTRPNTLLDDADDLQRQLDNEARERFQYTKPKTVWMLHKPEKISPRPPTCAQRGLYGGIMNTKRKQMIGYSHFNPKAAKARSIANDAPEWSYSSPWTNDYPLCGGRSQSPVSIPSGGGGMVTVRSTRPLQFKQYDAIPQAMTLLNDGKKLVLTGRWAQDERPSLWGGAALSRRYLFHSVELHWFSEHRVGFEQYPCELQARHYAAEYADYETALRADDPESLLSVAYLYQYANVTHPPGISTLISAAVMLSERTYTFSNNAINVDSTSATQDPSKIPITQNEQPTETSTAENIPSEIPISENGPPMKANAEEAMDIKSLKPCITPSEKIDIHLGSTKEDTVITTAPDQFSDKPNDIETSPIIVNTTETCAIPNYTDHHLEIRLTAHTQSITSSFDINDCVASDNNTNEITMTNTPMERIEPYAAIRAIKDKDADLVEDKYNLDGIKYENDLNEPSVMPLTNLFPVFEKDYATYSGSLTSPPCKENVRWIVYSRPLGIRREFLAAVQSLRSVDGRMKANYRPQQPLNDRKIYYFH